MSQGDARTRRDRRLQNDHLESRRLFNALARTLDDAFARWLAASTLGDADRELLELDRLRVRRDRARRRLNTLLLH